MEWYYIAAIGLFVLILLIVVLKEKNVVETDYSDDEAKEGIVYYYLPQSVLNIKSLLRVAVLYVNEEITRAEIIEQTFALSTMMIADTTELLAMRYVSDIFSADEVRFEVNANGLLETGNVTTEDRMPQIVTTLGDAPSTILSLESLDTQKEEVKIHEYTREFSIRFSSLESDDFKLDWPVRIVNEYGKKNMFHNLEAGFEIQTDMREKPDKRLDKILEKTRNLETGKRVVSGLLTRPLKNVTLLFKTNCQDKKKGETTVANISVADVTKAVIVPVRRKSFGKRTNKISMKEGIILSHEVINPSSFENFISIPVRIAKAVVSIPAQLVQFKFDNTKRATELEKVKLDYEKSVLDMEKFSKSRELELEKVFMEKEKFMISKQAEIDKVHSELKTSLLKSEKERMEAQKALDEIKKQLEILK